MKFFYVFCIALAWYAAWQLLAAWSSGRRPRVGEIVGNALTATAGAAVYWKL